MQEINILSKYVSDWDELANLYTYLLTHEQENLLPMDDNLPVNLILLNLFSNIIFRNILTLAKIYKDNICIARRIVYKSEKGKRTFGVIFFVNDKNYIDSLNAWFLLKEMKN